ncbi:MAG: hypothetical protein N3I35_16205 [Clostridia bacterium]|nr:hypothetical protein [Clostridia bacterium]
MFRLGLVSLFLTLTKLMAIIIIYDFYSVYKFKAVSSGPISNGMKLIPSFLWYVIITEIIISGIIIVFGFKNFYFANNKKNQ